MKSVAVILGVAACTMLAADLAGAQAYPPGTVPNLDRRVFVDVNRVTPSKVLDELADTIACTLDVDRTLPQPDISLRLSNVRARTALDAICDMVGCRWILKGATLVVTATAPPPAIPPTQQWLEKAKTPLVGIRWKLDRVPLRDVLAWLSQEVGANVTFEGVDPTTPITEDLRGRSPMYAFMRLPVAVGYNLSGMSMRHNPTSGWDEIRLEGKRDTEPRREPVSVPLRVYDASEPGLTLPTPTASVGPQYPRDAMQRKVEGTVVVAGVVDVDGTVRDISVTRPLDPALDERAVAAARQWRFVPGMKDGKAVPVRVELYLTFTLKAVLLDGAVGLLGQQPTATKPANPITYDEFMALPVQQRQEKFGRLGADSKASMVRTHAERWVAANKTRLGSSELGALQEAIAFITPRIYEAPMDPQVLKLESDVKASMRCRVHPDDVVAAFSVFNSSPIPQEKARWSYLSQAKCWIGWFAESVVDYIPTPRK